MLVVLLTAALLAMGSAQSTGDDLIDEDPSATPPEVENQRQSPDEQFWGPLTVLFDYEEDEENDLQQGANQPFPLLPPCGNQRGPPQQGSHEHRPHLPYARIQQRTPWLGDHWQRPHGPPPGNQQGPALFRGQQWQTQGPCPSNQQGPPPFQRHRPQGPPQ